MCMHRILSKTLVLGFVCALICHGVSANDEGSVAALAQRECNTCHRPGTEACNPSIPRFPYLNGLNKDHIISQLRAFKEGSRKDAVMNIVAKRLSDKEIENMATYFSNLKRK